MTAINPPSDTSSLLVPVHVDAWVISQQSQPVKAFYKADYTRLPKFKGLLDPPFSSNTAKPVPGVRLHWALPDALTHGRTPEGGGETIFPLVPNRWLIARFNLPAGGKWECKLWVIQSDYTGGGVGRTSAVLKGGGVTTVPLAAPGAQLAISAGDQVQIINPDGTQAATVVTAEAVAKGATTIKIRAFDFSAIKPGGLVTNSFVRINASSPFLDPTNPSSMSVTTEGAASFKVQLADIGKSYDIAAWRATGGASTERLFLQAVGPGNVSFAAYMPTVNDVFSFTDMDLPPEGQGVINKYTYMVVGWYSDPAQGDPLRGVTTYDRAVWETQQQWEKQTPTERMATLLSYLKWSIKDKDGKPVASPDPLSTSLYHGLVAGVQWPPPRPGDNPGQIDPRKVHVAVGNTSADALSALVQSEAHARGEADKDHKSDWTKAGDTLAELMQAAMYDLLDKYGKPGGAVLIEQQIEQAWFGSDQGGTLWEVVAAASQNSDPSTEPPQLTPAQSAAIAAVLATLNSAQVTFDENMRKLISLQMQLYHMWWKVGRANSYSLFGGFAADPDTTPDWSILMPFLLTLYDPICKATWQQYCAVAQAEAKLPNPTPTDPKDTRAPDKWADANPDWLFPDSTGAPKKLKLSGLGLKLKASAMPKFWHPNDPVLMVSGIDRARRHGEDGRYNADGTLTCRTPGQTITGLVIQGQPGIDADAVTKGGVNLAPCGSFASIPSVPSLMAEAFFVDPSDAPAIAGAVPGTNAAAITTAITNLLAGKPGAGTSWAGTPPAPFSIEPWDQAWSPLFLEWKVSYYPTGKNWKYLEGDWQFDGSQYAWMGTGFNTKFYEYEGRTLLTPHAPLTFKSKIAEYLKSHPDVDSARLEELLTTVAGWDVLSQNLSGLMDQFITLKSQETFPPPPPAGSTVECPPGTRQPDVALLIGDQHHSVPIVETFNSLTFFPLRAGFTRFQSLQIVDTFGQVFGGDIDRQEGQSQSVWINTPQGFQPTLGQGLALSCAPTVPSQTAQTALKQIPFGAFQLPPRLVQSARLDIEFLANDGSGKSINVSANPNPVCGWLVPNHLDGGISVYDGKGAPLGELLALPPGTKCDNWRPRPGDPGTQPPPTCPVDIPNKALSAVVQSIAAQSQAAFSDLLKTIDETLWMVDPLGGRKDQFLSVLIGRPLAVVQARLKLSLHGDPVFNQYWNKTCTNPDAQEESQCEQLKDIGGVLDLNFPVRLGSLELRDDGLIGYYLPAGDNYATLYTVHYPEKIAEGDRYLRRIIDPAPPTGGRPYQGDILLRCNGEAVTVTMLIDPRGSVHAYTGVLPVVSAALPGQLIEEFIRELQVTFRTGPVVADPGTMRIPQPAEQHGVWSWVQAVTSSDGKPAWSEVTIVDADDQARMPDAQLQLREGWLRLSGLSENG